MNPAQTGRFYGDMRSSWMYRSYGYDLSKPYSTFYMSIEDPVYIKKESFNIGGYFSHDNSAGSSITANQFTLATSKEIRLSLNHALIVGLSAGYVLKQINTNGLTFPDQYSRETGTFDPSLPTSDIFEESKNSYLDLGFGLLSSNKLTNGSLSIGFAMFHLNRPNETFFGINNQIPLKWTVHAKSDLNLSKSIFILPMFVYVEMAKANESIIGANIGHVFGNEGLLPDNIIGGLHMRYSDLFRPLSYILTIGTKVKEWQIMVNYDIEAGNHRNNQMFNTAIELNLNYTLPSTKHQFRVLSCERY